MLTAAAHHIVARRTWKSSENCIYHNRPKYTHIMATKTIKLQDLSIDQLATFKKETESEFEQFNYSLAALNTAVAKYKSNKVNIESVTENKLVDREILVPLTASMYVKGKPVNTDKFMCDVGTGYFIEKSGKDAKEFYEQKIVKLGEDSKKLKEIIANKQEMLRSVDGVLQEKVRQYYSKQ